MSAYHIIEKNIVNNNTSTPQKSPTLDFSSLIGRPFKFIVNCGSSENKLLFYLQVYLTSSIASYTSHFDFYNFVDHFR